MTYVVCEGNRGLERIKAYINERLAQWEAADIEQFIKEEAAKYDLVIPQPCPSIRDFIRDNVLRVIMQNPEKVAKWLKRLAER